MPERGRILRFASIAAVFVLVWAAGAFLGVPPLLSGHEGLAVVTELPPRGNPLLATAPADHPRVDLTPIPAPNIGWDGRLLAVAVVNAPLGPVEIQLGHQTYVGSLGGRAIGPHHFRAAVGTVFAPRPGTHDPIRITLLQPTSPWRVTNVRIGSPDAVLAEDGLRFVLRLGLASIVFGAMVSTLIALVQMRTPGSAALLGYWLVLITNIAIVAGLVRTPDGFDANQFSAQLDSAGFVMQLLMVRRFCDLPSRAPRLAQITQLVAGAGALFVAGQPLVARVASEAGYLWALGLSQAVMVSGAVFLVTRESVLGGRVGRELLMAWWPWWGLVGLLFVTHWIGQPGGQRLWASWVLEVVLCTLAWQAAFLTLAIGRRMRRMRKERDTIRQVASSDGLTNLANRAAMEEALRERIVRSRLHGSSLAVVFVDIDHFKRINDEHGHDVGDEVLIRFTQRLSRASRPDDLISRYGGEEFVVLLAGADMAGATQLAQRFRAAVAGEPFEIDGRQIAVTASFGVAVLGPDDTARDLVRRADGAMYRAKRNGRDRVESEPAGDPSPTAGLEGVTTPALSGDKLSAGRQR